MRDRHRTLGPFILGVVAGGLCLFTALQWFMATMTAVLTLSTTTAGGGGGGGDPQIKSVVGYP